MGPIDILFYATVYITLFISVFWFTTYFFSDRNEKKPGFRYRPLSIIVPAYNEEESIEKCVKSLLAQKYRNLKIIVVDDGSTDRTGGIVKSLAKGNRNITYIKKKNAGKAAAINTGLKHVGTELFGFLDSDTYLSKKALKNMVCCIRGDVASVIATIKPYKPVTMIEKIQQIEYMISSFTRKLLSFIDSLYYTPGFAIYKTGVIKKLGGFDEDNITEDLEIGLRLKNNGYRIENSIEDSAYTTVPETFRELFHQRMRWYRGYIHNTRKYSHMFFNRNFGDLGILVLPIQYIMLALIIPLFIIGIYDNAILISQRIIDVFIVNFDVKYLVSTLHINFISPTTFFVLSLLVSFIFMISLSEKKIREKISKIDYIVYIILYPFINLILWIAVFAYELTGRKREW